MTGCPSKVSRAELIGRYDANVPEGKDMLRVRADGTYDHTYARPGGVEHTETSTWMLEPDEADGEKVTFNDFTFQIAPYKSDRPGFWPARPSKRFGKIRFEINDDMRLYYTKQE